LRSIPGIFNDTALHSITFKYTTLHYATLHYTTLLYATLHYTTPHHTTRHHTAPHHTTRHYTTLHYTALQLQLQLQLRHFTLDYTRLHYTTLNYITLRSLHHDKCNCNDTTLITPHHNYNSTTLQPQLQPHYTTLHPAVVGEVTDQVTTATIATTLKNTAPATFRSISGFALPSGIHSNQPLLWVSYF